jgi:hypothetical protein
MGLMRHMGLVGHISRIGLISPMSPIRATATNPFDDEDEDDLMGEATFVICHLSFVILIRRRLP